MAQSSGLCVVIYADGKEISLTYQRAIKRLNRTVGATEDRFLEIPLVIAPDRVNHTSITGQVKQGQVPGT